MRQKSQHEVIRCALYLRNLSYKCPEATEKMLMTSSFSCLVSSTFWLPVNPLEESILEYEGIQECSR